MGVGGEGETKEARGSEIYVCTYVEETVQDFRQQHLGSYQEGIQGYTLGSAGSPEYEP